MRKILDSGQWLKSHVAIDAITECWNWNQQKDKAGYGRVTHKGEAYAHRLSYKLFVGEIPSELEIDHICKNKACCNPNHLRLVIRQENLKHRRFRWKGIVCIHGTYPQNKCRICMSEQQRQWRQANPEKYYALKKRIVACRNQKKMEKED